MMDRRSPFARPKHRGSAPGLSRRQALAGLSLLCAPPLHAQERPVVAFVALASREESYFNAFIEGLAANGIQPGRAVQVVERYGNGDPERIRAAIRDLVADGTRFFVAGGPNIARLVTERAPDARIVVASLESLESAGAAGPIARPAGNVTGFATLGAELIGKRIELLRELLPDLAHVIVVMNPDNRHHPALFEGAEQAAGRLGLTASRAPVEGIGELDAVIAAARRPGLNGAVLVRDYLLESNRAALVAALGRARLPSSFDERIFVQLGGLMSYAVNRVDLFRRSATYIARMLEGTHPRDLPIQQPTRFDLALNAQAARTLGVTIPPSILLRADEVIE